MTNEAYRLESQRTIRDLAHRRGVSPSLVRWRDKREEGRCRMCLRSSSLRPLTRHHIVPRVWFKRNGRVAVLRNVSANIVPLCWPCHEYVEWNQYGRSLLRKVLAAEEVAFVLQVSGREWFDRRYPAHQQRAVILPSI